MYTSREIPLSNSITVNEEVERVRAMENAAGLNERTTQTAIVLPIFRALGWNTADPDEVTFEQPVAGHLRGSVDIVLISREKPLVLIETKAPSQSLDAEKNRNQLFDYCRMMDVSLGVLTNGVEWRFYLGGGSAELHLAEVFDLIKDQPLECVLKLERLLSRDKVSDEGAYTYAKKAWFRRTLVQAWDRLLSSGDKGLKSRLRKAVKESTGVDIPGLEVEDFLKQQAISSSEQVLVGQENAERASTPPPSPDPGRSKHPKPTHVVVFGRRVEVKSWKEAMLVFLSEAYKDNPDSFQALVEHQSYLVQSSVPPGKFRRAVQIAQSDLWINVDYNGKNMVRICRDVQKLLGLTEDTLNFFHQDKLL